GCERALVGLGDMERGIRRRFHRVRPGGDREEAVVSRLILQATLDRRQAVIVRDGQREAKSATMIRERILSAMATPIGLGARPAGFLYVDDRQQTERFHAQDLEFLSALGHLLAAALENAERYQRAEAMAEALSHT